MAQMCSTEDGGHWRSTVSQGSSAERQTKGETSPGCEQISKWQKEVSSQLALLELLKGVATLHDIQGISEQLESLREEVMCLRAGGQDRRMTNQSISSRIDDPSMASMETDAFRARLGRSQSSDTNLTLTTIFGEALGPTLEQSTPTSEPCCLEDTEGDHVAALPASHRPKLGSYQEDFTAIADDEDAVRTSTVQIEDRFEDIMPDVMLATSAESDSPRMQRSCSIGDRNSMQNMDQLISDNDDASSNSRSYRCQLHPDSWQRVSWDFISLFTLVFDSVTIPLIIGWSLESEGVILVGVWVTALYWSFDVIVNLCTAYFTKEGDLERRQGRIFMQYLKSTLVFDTFICTTDWVAIVLDLLQKGSSGGDLQNDSQASTLLRIIKFNRALRLLRVVRVTSLWSKYCVFLSSTSRLIGQVVSLFVFIVWLNHLLSCVWYGIGTAGMSSDTGFSWLDNRAIGGSDTKMEDTSMLFQYTTAYHWSISQLTPGSMEIFPNNSMERVFNIALLLFGLLFCTSLISRLSALMVQLQIANQDKANVMVRLRTFLQQKNISTSVCRRVEKQLTEQLSTVLPLCMQDVPILGHLSKPLRSELKVDMCSSHLIQHSVFFTLDSINRRGTVALCDSLEMRLVKAHQELFERGSSTRTSYILISGSMFYVEDDLKFEQSHVVNQQFDSENSSKPIALGSWVSPMAFWMQWKTKGSIDATQHSEVICIDGSAAYPVIVNSNPRVAMVLRLYKQRFTELWEGMSAYERRQVTDLDDPVDHTMVVMALPRPIRNAIYEPLLETLRQRNRLKWGSGEAIKNLESELLSGKCALVAGKDDTVMRIAVVIALNIKRPGGAVLLEIAEVKEDICKISARPPGSKLREKETVRTCATRVLDELLKDIAPDDPTSFVLERCEYVVKECSASPTYGMQTEYHRNIFRVSQVMESTRGPPRLSQAERSSERSDGSSNDFSQMSPHLSPGDPLEVPSIIQTHLPYLAGHYPHHIHLSSKGDGTKTVIYAWVHPDDVQVFDWKGNAPVQQ